MRRKDRAMQDRKDIDALLVRCLTGHLGMTDGDRPYVLPFNYLYDPSRGRIFIHCAHIGMKLEMIARNPKVCFEVCEVGVPEEPDDPRCPEWWRSVVAFGTIREIEDVAEKLSFLNGLIRKYGKSHEPATEEMARKTTVLGMDIEEVTGKYYGTDECPRDGGTDN